MRLQNLLKDAGVIRVLGNKSVEIKGITLNSKKVETGFLFAAIPGFKKDGHDFVAEAVRNGASAVLVQRIVEIDSTITQVLVKECRAQLPVICRNFYNDPTGQILLLGITGTNGKTTTVFLIDSILRSAGFRTSYITTVKAEIAGKGLVFDRTTPESPELNRFFARSLEDGVNASCMEVSSHSIDLHRVDMLDFDYFAFTNLTQDHLDYHENMEKYFEVKSRLFLPQFRHIFGGKGAVINIDDPYGARLAQMADIETLTFSIKEDSANLKAENIRSSVRGIEMDVVYCRIPEVKKIKKFSISSDLCGYFNVYNILASVGTGLIAGVDTKDIMTGIKTMHGVNGRFEKIDTGKNFYAIVDYAHTPDGLENVLRTARSLLLPGAKLISVFGCGGDRDRKKRKIMGLISATLADFTIITSDNPRTEKPRSIIEMIEAGFIQLGGKNYKKETDRKEAINYALGLAEKNDIILIAGKGHEDYQEFAGNKIHFSDQEIVREWSKA